MAKPIAHSNGARRRGGFDPTPWDALSDRQVPVAVEPPKIPVEPGEPSFVYFLRDADGRLLYVGVSTTRLRMERFKGHAKDKDWWPEVTTINVEHYDSRQEALRREAEAIADLNPVHNISRPTLRAGIAAVECPDCGREIKAVEGRRVCETCTKRRYRQRKREEARRS